MSFHGKRSNSLLEEFDGTVEKKRVRHETTVGNEPLRGVVACLTGLTHDAKIHFHSLIESLGGTYTREFNLDKNTHLIAEIANGAKYDLASSCPRIHIVRPTWLISCSQQGKHVEESIHSLSAKKRPSPSNILLQIDTLLKENTTSFPSPFEFHQFYFLGFEKDPKLREKLSQIIRRGKGTIFWEMNEGISIMIMHDMCDSVLRKAAKAVKDNHVNMPPSVSPLWVIESYKNKFPAIPTLYPPMEPIDSPPKQNKASKATLSRADSTTTSSIFRGSLFSLVRIAPPSWALDFDPKEQESLIKTHGGQMLSLRLIDAMRVDARNGGQRRKCHVVCWGGRPHLELNPILSQLQRHDLCDIILTTPIWLKTCIEAQKRVSPDIVPLALAPQPWPLRKIESKISVSITLSGFSGTEKLAFSQLIVSLGGCFSDNMLRSNTHLIVCPEKASRLKVEKAAQWRLHVVTIDWLHHIVEHGFSGLQKDKGGCESKFLFQGVATRK